MLLSDGKEKKKDNITYLHSQVVYKQKWEELTPIIISNAHKVEQKDTINCTS